MYRIRFHGRGGQGIKTAGRILGTAFFLEGFEVQDAPRYGAERRGAPIATFVRAARLPINERGVIPDPDLVAVADDTLVAEPSAGVLQGLGPRSPLLIATATEGEVWQRRLNRPRGIIALAVEAAEVRTCPWHASVACAAAAARLVGVIGRDALARAVRRELADVAANSAAEAEGLALAVFDRMAEHAGRVLEAAGAETAPRLPPRWIELAAEGAERAAPAVHRPVSSELARTGLWRIMRPVIDHERCRRCVWVCGEFCPDNAIKVDAKGFPAIDLDHCKGCLICMAQCPTHAIRAVPESAAAAEGPA